MIFFRQLYGYSCTIAIISVVSFSRIDTLTLKKIGKIFIVLRLTSLNRIIINIQIFKFGNWGCLYNEKVFIWSISSVNMYLINFTLYSKTIFKIPHYP